MADDDIDVEGEFDLKSELGDEFYDANELPSKSANLLPEFTSPAWMLEQGWSLDSCMDEKSKATIEKMLLEEQQYLYGRKTSRYLSIKKNVLLVTAGTSKTTVPNKSPWTQEEKNAFLRGMGIFGRSWSKIASLIPSRTSLQVKNYAQQYMKNLAKKKAEIERMEMETLKSMTETPLFTPSSLAATIASVTTAQPTITVTTSSTSAATLSKESQLAQKLLAAIPPKPSVSNNAKLVRNTVIPKGSAKVKKKETKKKDNKKSLSKSKITPKTNGKEKKKVVQKSQKVDSSLGDILTFSDVSGSSGVKHETNLILKQRHKGGRSDSVHSSSNGSSIINEGNDISNSSSAKDARLSDEDDIDIDVDIENDDDEDCSTLLTGRSASPSSVYQQLLRSAQIDVGPKKSTKTSQVVNAKKSVIVDNLSKEKESTTPEENFDSVVASTSNDIPSTSNDNIVPVKTEDSEDNEAVTNDDSFQELIPDGNSLDYMGSNDGETDKDYEDEEDDFCIKTEIVNGVVSASGEVIEFEIPEEEKIFPVDFISEEEKRVHSDFFDGRPPKTPERYLKIRSYIVDCWIKNKPIYLNKTSVRPGLKNCGDVNCIGRIHAYLEYVGAINFGCDQAAYRNPQRNINGGPNSRAKGMNRELMASFPVTKSEFMRPRKRRIRDEAGVWVDEKELEGKTIDHNVVEKKKIQARKIKSTKPMKQMYNPFKLVPCLSFTSEKKEPYNIEIFNTALSIMDIHSHISKTEVIGMLGGQYNAKTESLIISMAVPCKSMSTGMQCEMDPVSQTLASEQIEDVGMLVVGWYHSHPTFSPDPSVRDIETQQKFQYWFSKGGNHFIGIIISPYNTSSNSTLSDIRCLTISDEHSSEFLCNIPYKFEYQIVYKDNLREILGPASELAEKYSNYVNRVVLSCQYKASLGITCLSKMLESVKRLLVPPAEESSTSVEKVTSCEISKLSGASSLPPDHSLTISTSSASSALALSTSSGSSSSSFSLANRCKLDEVLHWLEQIFLEKFSQSAPLSPTIESLASNSNLSPSVFEQPSSSLIGNAEEEEGN